MPSKVICALLLSILSLLAAAQGQSEALPGCSYEDEPVPATRSDYLFAPVDTRFRLPALFTPPDLIAVRAAGLDDDRTLREPVVADLAALLDAAATRDLHYELQSAYRSFSYQERVFGGWVESLGRSEALLTSARPGHSEHQLGTAIDLRSAGGPAPWDITDWAQTEEGAWLKDNAWRFGFVMSYPEGRQEITCYAYEPWHYRWVGREAAAEVRASGLTLREWLWRRVQEESSQ